MREADLLVAVRLENSRETEIAHALVATRSIEYPELGHHLKATAALAVRLASALQLGEQAVRRSYLGAILHDLGDTALAAAGEGASAPTPLHLAAIAQHPVLAAAILERIPALADLAPIVRCHHERHDGSGYPTRLPGRLIPIESRIIAVVDAFHAMTTPSPLRTYLSPTAAIAEIVDCAGTQFDPDVVSAFASLWRPEVATARAC